MNFLNELQLNSFKGVPAVPPTPRIWASGGVQKPLKNDAEKEKQKSRHTALKVVA